MNSCSFKFDWNSITVVGTTKRKWQPLVRLLKFPTIVVCHLFSFENLVNPMLTWSYYSYLILICMVWSETLCWIIVPIPSFHLLLESLWWRCHWLFWCVVSKFCFINLLYLSNSWTNTQLIDASIFIFKELVAQTQTHTWTNEMVVSILIMPLLPFSFNHLHHSYSEFLYHHSWTCYLTCLYYSYTRHLDNYGFMHSCINNLFKFSFSLLVEDN